MLLPLYPIIIDDMLELRLIRIIPILDIPARALVMHVCDLVDFLQSRLSAIRANCEWVIREVLEVLEMLQALVAMVDVDRHQAAFL